MKKETQPKPRKHAQLYQTYLIWNELMRMRVKHLQRLSTVQAGKSQFDAALEQAVIDNLDPQVKFAKKAMVNMGKATGPIWDWLVSIRGLGEGGLAAQLIAQIDDISLAPTVSSLWRFAGYAVIEGKAEKNKKGEMSHYNRKLKTVCFLICDSFIKQQTSPYIDIYYAEKSRLRQLHPEKIKVDGKTRYNDGHLHYMAMRKMVKLFLSHLWVKWRELEGLPVSLPYAHAILGHSDYIVPQEAALAEE